MAYQPKVYKKDGGNTLMVETGGSAQTTKDVGTPGTGVTAVEYGVGEFHKTVLTLAPAAISVADGAQNAHAHIYTFPAGAIKILCATLDGVIVNTANFNASTADIYNAGIGTADGSGTLSTTEQNVIAVTAFDTASGTVLSFDWHAQTDIVALLDGTSSAVDVRINIDVPTANDSGLNTFTVTGTLTLIWVNAGDY
jgi:hypothetical protein